MHYSRANAAKPIWVTTTAAQAMLSVGKTKLFEMLNAGDLESGYLGKRRMVLTSSIDRLVERSVAQAA